MVSLCSTGWLQTPQVSLPSIHLECMVNRRAGCGGLRGSSLSLAECVSQCCDLNHLLATSASADLLFPQEAGGSGVQGLSMNLVYPVRGNSDSQDNDSSRKIMNQNPTTVQCHFMALIGPWATYSLGVAGALARAALILWL